jgi:N-ethylmaleimide reductase
MLFDSHALGTATLANRTVMAPMTRSRAVNHNTPNALMAEYYAQRASAGLIITEGLSPSPNGLGYARIPGLFNAEHVAGWRLTTDAVHAKGGKIFAQFMHCGRVAHRPTCPQARAWSDPALTSAPARCGPMPLPCSPTPRPRP